MTGTQLAALIHYKARTTSTSFPAAEMLVHVNNFKNEICSLLTQKNNTLFQLQVAQDLTADDRTYAWDADVLNHIIEVEVAFSQTTPIPYVKCIAIDRENWPKALTESNIIADFDNVNPRYFVRARGIYLLSGSISSTVIGAATVASGVRITIRKFPADLANLSGSTDLAADPSGTTFGFPRTLHELLARRVVIEWKSSQPKPIKLSPLENKYPEDLEAAIDALSREDFSQEIHADLPTAPGNNGYDY